MGKKDSQFNQGSLVFARVKGYAPWPAKITKVDKKKYSVYFYGTGEISSNLKPEDVFEYQSNKAKFVIDKNLKRKFYKEAVDQIEAALKGEDISDDISAIAAGSPDVSTIDSTVDESDKEKNIANESVTSMVNTPKSSPKAKLEIINIEKEDEKKEDDEPPNSTEGDTLVSRSGRKIKPKRYLIDEDEEPSYTSKKRAFSNDTKRTWQNESQDKEIEAHLKLESLLIELDHLIKSSVGLSGANPDKCIEHLNEYKKLKITTLMLKKHPHCVETMKRLRRYVGNVKAWEMEESLKQDFDQKAQQIRTQAEEIYGNFKQLFNFSSETTPFWDFFMEKVNSLREKTLNLSKDEFCALIVDPDSNLENLLKPIEPPKHQ